MIGPTTVHIFAVHEHKRFQKLSALSDRHPTYTNSYTSMRFVGSVRVVEGNAFDKAKEIIKKLNEKMGEFLLSNAKIDEVDVPQLKLWFVELTAKDLLELEFDAKVTNRKNLGGFVYKGLKFFRGLPYIHAVGITQTGGKFDVVVNSANSAMGLAFLDFEHKDFWMWLAGLYQN